MTLRMSGACADPLQLTPSVFLAMLGKIHAVKRLLSDEPLTDTEIMNRQLASQLD